MPVSPVYSKTIAIPLSAIDENGHVNNVVYVQWMQDIAIEHYASIGGIEAQGPDATWVVREHKVEYLLPAFEGEQIEIRRMGGHAAWHVIGRRLYRKFGHSNNADHFRNYIFHHDIKHGIYPLHERDESKSLTRIYLPQMPIRTVAANAMDVRSGLWAYVEHICHAWSLSRLWKDVASDLLPALRHLVTARRLVS